MSLFTVHLVKTSLASAIKAMWFPPQPNEVKGLIHGECMQGMTLGSPIFSTQRILLRQLVFFAQWKDESAINAFLQHHTLGRILSRGWHMRMVYLRQWGYIDGFQIPATNDEMDDPKAPVVAFTLARMKLLQVPRFIYWGRPVEKQVRDDPAATLALAATRLPRTVATLSIWKSQLDMIKMVRGKSSVDHPSRHINAMKERERKDFHTQFTTLRFKPISEHGEWQGRTFMVPPKRDE